MAVAAVLQTYNGCGLSNSLFVSVLYCRYRSQCSSHNWYL